MVEETLANIRDSKVDLRRSDGTRALGLTRDPSRGQLQPDDMLIQGETELIPLDKRERAKDHLIDYEAYSPEEFERWALGDEGVNRVFDRLQQSRRKRLAELKRDYTDFDSVVDELAREFKALQVESGSKDTDNGDDDATTLDSVLSKLRKDNFRVMKKQYWDETDESKLQKAPKWVMGKNDRFVTENQTNEGNSQRMEVFGNQSFGAPLVEETGESVHSANFGNQTVGKETINLNDSPRGKGVFGPEDSMDRAEPAKSIEESEVIQKDSTDIEGQKSKKSKRKVSKESEEVEENEEEQDKEEEEGDEEGSEENEAENEAVEESKSESEGSRDAEDYEKGEEEDEENEEEEQSNDEEHSENSDSKPIGIDSTGGKQLKGVLTPKGSTSDLTKKSELKKKVTFSNQVPK